MGYRFCVYIKDEEIEPLIKSKKNKSEYVERAIRFYEDNKDIVNKLAECLTKENLKS